MRTHVPQTIGLLAVGLALVAPASSRAQVWPGGQGTPSAASLPPSGIELEVPFANGVEVQVSQAHGTFSHKGRDYWGWDFRVPEDVPIVAAHDGVVRLARGDSRQGGCFREAGSWANYVTLSHPGGYETQYLHFARVFVRPGQRIKAGQVLGTSGSTGFSCGSHLHFQLQRPGPGGHWAGQSVPATFRGLGDPQAETILVSRNRAPAASGPEAALQARR